jgi:F-type H+-transporting ATPase subunit b
MFTETFWVAVALIAFLAICVKFGVPSMITGALDARGKQVQAELDEATSLRQAAEKLLADIKKQKIQAETDAKDILAQAQKDAIAMKADAETKLKDFVARRTAQADVKIQQAETQALAEVRAAAADLASATAGELIRGGNVGADLISSGIKEVRAVF